MSSKFLGFISLTCMVFSTVAQALTPTDMGHLGGGSASVGGVANGYVTGSSATASSNTHAFLWSAATQTMRDLGVLPGTNDSNGYNVNSNGEVVGKSGGCNSDYSVCEFFAFYWSAATGMIPINSISNAGYNGANVVINDVGSVGGVDAYGSIYRWTLAGGIQNLGQACTDQSFVTAINARGDIIGDSGNPGFPGASACSFFAPGSSNTLTLLYSPGTSSPPTNLGYTENQGEVNIQVKGINDTGVVVGTYFDYGVIYYGYAIPLGGFYSATLHNSHAFQWTLSGGFVDLGSLGALQDPYQLNVVRTNSSANAISNSGVIVGNSNLSSGINAGFVYNPSTHELTPLPYVSNVNPGGSGTGIDNDVIVGLSGSYAYSGANPAMWQAGIPIDLRPSFAPLYGFAPFIKGSTIAGSGYDNNWNSHAWTLSVASAPSPVDCVVVPAGFSACSASCGGGTQTEILTVLTPAANGGAACRAPATQACNTQSCQIDCQVSDWSAFGDCSASCGGGIQTQTRTILVPAANGGTACPALTNTQACNTQVCVTYAWMGSGFGACTPANGVCGSGTQTQSVSCQGSDGITYSPNSCTGAPPASSQSCSTACSGAQLTELACPTKGTYKNHGDYVSCVAKRTNSLVSQGLLTSVQRSSIVSAAAQSSIGK